jgi:L-serine dehydratase
MTSKEPQADPQLPANVNEVVPETPEGIDRRAFMMRSAMFGAVAVLSGCAPATDEQVAKSPAPKETAAGTAPGAGAGPVSGMSPDLDVAKRSKGPVMTVLDEFYKVGPGPSSSHTIGPMRITYDFYQRCTKLPADQLAKATALKVHLYGSLSATGKGHGTERAALAGIIGKEPATIDPAFLDELAAKPDQTFPVELGGKTFNASLADIIYDAPKGDFKHPNTMTCKLMAGDAVLLEQEYYSVGGGFIEWKGYEPPKKGQPAYPYSRMKELQEHATKNNLTFAQVAMANEVAVSGKSEAEINAFLDKISTAMVNIVKSGLNAPPATLPGPIKLKTKAGDVYKRAMDDAYEKQRGVGVVAAYALAGSEENARGHLVVTAPTGGSAGVIPALVYVLGEGGRKLPQEKIRQGLLAAAVVGYLCKHNATLAGAEGGCQAEIGVASAMGAALIA